MEPASESISVRSMRLNEVLGGPSIMATTALNKELLFDAIILLFDECNNEFMKTDPLIVSFVSKCECSLKRCPQNGHLLAVTHRSHTKYIIILHRNYYTFLGTGGVVFLLFSVKMVIPELKSLRVNRLDFESKQVIGKGHFGDVELVVEKHTNDVFAMKVLKKDNLLNQRDVLNKIINIIK